MYLIKYTYCIYTYTALVHISFVILEACALGFLQNLYFVFLQSGTNPPRKIFSQVQ